MQSESIRSLPKDIFLPDSGELEDAVGDIAGSLANTALSVSLNYFKQGIRLGVRLMMELTD